MRAASFFAAALVLAVSAPAFSQDGAPAPAPPSSMGTPSNFLSYNDIATTNLPGFETRRQMCFNGRAVTGANRVGDRVVYVQSRGSGIFRLEMSEGCGALKAAEKLSVRSAIGQEVCAGGAPATLVLKTAAGSKTCRIEQVRRLTATELAALTSAAAR
ncbi:MAG: hypothetical protein JNL41_13270 [Phenylobacterium sp.]|uniref:DUF6491 family protein n=1 Tax=Phenylobacterium sp. TaxID=1871053 RepID=UPI001A363BBD|nr:DUF6491 family protein [Phenylobacterium sp.]MBL8555246.1 hypothetical protein [Phenylobacterium sp.]